MNCDETFNAGICYVTDAYKRVCKFNEELHASLEKYRSESAKLREQMERLVTLLRNDCDIEASWDGLRRFWSIELTEGGCLMRDRACKAEAENAKLREQVHWLKKGDILHVLTDQEYIDQCERERLMQVSIDALDKENAKLRELAAGIGHLLFALDVDYCAGCPRDDINHPCPVYTVKGGECLYETDLRELGVEVNDGN